MRRKTVSHAAIIVAALSFIRADGCSLGSSTSPDSVSGSTPQSSAPYAEIRTNSGTAYSVAYDTFSWGDGDLMGTRHSTLYLKKDDCATVEISKSSTDWVEYRGKTINPCNGRSAEEFVVQHSGTTTQGWTYSSPTIVGCGGFRSASSLSIQ
jgi:hypothetical protein